MAAGWKRRFSPLRQTDPLINPFDSEEFSTGWAVTSGSAKATAKEIATTAVVDRLAPIAVAQFMLDPNKDARLKELKALETWKRSDFVKAQGWAVMPGEKDSDYNVSVECARQLVELKL
jgi:hypothetical protein